MTRGVNAAWRIARWKSFELNRWRIALLTFAALLTFTAPAAADFGPKLGASDFRLSLTLDGAPLPSQEVRLAVLDAGPTALGKQVDSVADFEQDEFPKLPDRRWLFTKSGNVAGWMQMPPLGVERFQLVVRLADSPHLFVSNVATVHPLFARYRLDLRGDGTCTLALEDEESIVDRWALGLWRAGLPLAWGITCFVEAVVLGVIAGWWGKSAVGWAGRSVIGNTLTLPTLWVLTLVAVAVSRSVPLGLVVLAICEVTATLFEAAVYWIGAGVTFRQAFAASLLANCLSFLCGAILPVLS